MFDELKQNMDAECCFSKQQVMSKEHQTIPNEQQESPVQPGKPEVELPRDPQSPNIPKEAPQHEPTEMPKEPVPRPEIGSDETGSEFNKTEV
jgi:hypothetical protein